MLYVIKAYDKDDNLLLVWERPCRATKEKSKARTLDRLALRALMADERIVSVISCIVSYPNS